MINDSNYEDEDEDEDEDDDYETTTNKATEKSL